MDNFEDSFSSILSDMVFLSLDFCEHSVDKVFIHCSNESNCISSNIFFQKENKKLNRNQIKTQSDIEQKNFIHSINSKIKELELLCIANKQNVPTEIKMIYEVKTKHLITDFCYEKLYSNTDDKVVQDVFDEWYNSI